MSPLHLHMLPSLFLLFGTGFSLKRQSQFYSNRTQMMILMTKKRQRIAEAEQTRVHADNSASVNDS
ncbi:5825_t:CDS:2, partial [Gigaspora rosea]